jgi:peptide/nickel transport system ATP-binding protein
MQDQAKNIIEIRNLKVNFKSYLGLSKVLENINLNIKINSWFGLAGETGCGKSVTAYSILKLLPDSAVVEKGEIMFFGDNLLDKSEKQMQKIRGKDISMIFQDPQTSLNPALRIGEQLTETLFSHKNYSKKEAKKVAIEMLEKVKIPMAENRFKQYPHELSGGMKQRVVIAIALLCNPKLLIADEFTTNLDVTIQSEIINLVMNLQKEMSMSVLFITHDLALINDSCKQVGIMYAGQMMEIGQASEIFENPSHPYTIGLLKSIPSIVGKKKKLSSIKGFVPNLVNPPRGCRFHTRCENRIPGVCDQIIPKIINIGIDHSVQCHLFN